MKWKNLILRFVTTAMAVVAGIYLYQHYINSEVVISEPAAPIVFASESNNPVVNINFDFTKAADKSINAVVHITTTIDKEKYLKENPLLDYFLGDNKNFEMPIMGAGSGVIISPDGYIVTNNHVVANFDKISVILNDKRSYKAKIIATDLSTDLALLKIDENQLSYLEFANSDSCKVGEWVLAVGNPFNLTSTVTAGIISAKARNIGLLKDENAIESFIQTDAAVNPGNSGGALINPNGELVGINTAIASSTGSYAGYSFAIPSNIVKKIVSDLKLYGTVHRAILGAKIKDITEDIAQKDKLNTLSGVYIYDLLTEGAAAKAGLKQSDIIQEINGIKISKTTELQEQLSRYNPGDKIKVMVLRKNNLKEYEITLLNTNGNQQMKSYAEINLLGGGLSLIKGSALAQTGVENALKVESINPGKLQSANVPIGFIITKYNNKEIKSLEDFKQDIENYKGGVYLEGYLPNGEKAYFAFGLN
jgi:Do/DeqQ family serine protease